MPAVRKACGFVGHRARLGCSKCLCEFEHLKGDGMKWSGILEIGLYVLLMTIERNQMNITSALMRISKRKWHQKMDFVFQF